MKIVWIQDIFIIFALCFYLEGNHGTFFLNERFERIICYMEAFTDDTKLF